MIHKTLKITNNTLTHSMNTFFANLLRHNTWLLVCLGQLIQPQCSANCGWPTIICSASEGFTEVVSHVHFAQELTSSVTSASMEKDTWKNSLCITTVVFSPSVWAQPVLYSHCPCRDHLLRCKHPSALTGCLPLRTVAFRGPLGWRGPYHH